LEKLPTSLDETYQRMLEGIAKEQQQYAYRLFQCLTISMRPLRAKELAEIFAFRLEGDANPAFDARWRPEDADETLLSTCSTLITIVNVDGDHIVQFSHFSVKEFLTDDRLAHFEGISNYHILREPAHTFLARTCLSILLRLDHHVDEARIGDLPLASYAAEHWVDHAQFGNVSSLIRDDMESLFDSRPHFTTWIWIYDIDSPSSSRSPRIQREKVPLYYAALCGFRDTAEYLIITHGQDVNARGGRRATPLHAAVDAGHVSVAELLLEHRANANARDDGDQTPLHIASKRGDAEAIRLLIDKGANPNMEDEQEETPLSLALANGGGLDAARLLLQHGADAHHLDMSGKTLLHVASQNGNRSAVRLLLDHGANPRAGVEDRETPLHLASAHGKLELVRMLLQCGANIDARDHRGRTPLHFASLRRHLEVMRLLLDGGADVNAQKADGGTALHLAASSGHLQVVEWLLQSGADPRTRNNEGETSHQIASRKNHPEVARLLDLDIRGD
jgi:ankyrin repeat protein